MIKYIRAKTAEYQTTLGWIEDELRKLRSEKPEHAQLISDLISKLDDPKELLRKLVIISSLNPPRYIARAKTFIHEIEFWVIILTYHYLPALHKEITHKMNEAPVVTCDKCGLPMHRVPQSFRFYMRPLDVLIEWSDENWRRMKKRKMGLKAPRFSPNDVNSPIPLKGKDFEHRRAKPNVNKNRAN